MAVLQQFATTIGASKSVSVPQVTITAVVYSNDGALLADFTGANALLFPNVLTSLTAAQRQALVDQIAQAIVLMRAGLL